MRGRFVKLLISSIFCQFSILAQAQRLQEHFPAYQLQRSDIVIVTYRYTPEFDQTIIVGPDGRVSLSGFGSFIATGLTIDDFREQVLKLSAQRLVDPVVAVSLKEFEKPHVYVEGEVNTPGRVEYHGSVSALDAIAMAGGFKASGATSNVLLLRPDDGGLGKTRVMNLKQFISQHKLEEVPELRSGDVIFVTPNAISKVERLIHMGNFGAIYNPVR